MIVSCLYNNVDDFSQSVLKVIFTVCVRDVFYGCVDFGTFFHLWCFFFAGEIYAWGMGTSQQLGSGEDEDITTPQLMTGKQLQTRYSGQIMGLLVML